ncbi:MAG: hypothetical protein NTX65_01285 [Ignavibacteriales bacterium]|nr:hypothetical protein [Ignavibacteriales bacterium]
MTIASIDIGSNTVLLLLVEFNPEQQTFTSIANYQKIPRLSQGLTANGEITKEKIDILLDILADYKNICTKYNCSNILINATNAFRIASNSSEIIDLVKEKYSLEIKTITGIEEGRLTFLGSTFPFSDNESKIVFDIGGGSTEIILGDKQKIIYQNSYDIGVVSLTEKFLRSLPSTDAGILASEVYIDKMFETLSELIPQHSEAIAVAGTPTTLSCIKQGIKIFDESLVDNSSITFSELKKMIFELKKMSKEEVLNKYGKVVEGREDILLAGSLILLRVMKKLNFSRFRVSTKGLRYGAIVDYLIKNKLIEIDR